MAAGSGSAQAFELGVGIELGGTGTFAQDPAVRPDGTSPANAGVFAAGVLIEERFDGDAIAFELFEDIDSPFSLQTGGTSGATYVPLLAGVRAGLRIGPFIPYLGLVIGAGLLASAPSGSEPLSSSVADFGGTFGVDWVVADVRLGLEGRAVEILGGIPSTPESGLTPTNPSAAFVFQALFSVRLTLWD